VDQVQNYTGKPTVAQDEWIGIFEGQLKPLLMQLNDIVENHLPQLNQKLKDSNLKPIAPDAPPPAGGGGRGGQ